MRATLRFIGEELDPEAVSLALERAPTQSGRKGDRIEATLSRGRKVSRPASVGYWALELGGREPAQVRLSLHELLAALPGPAVWKDLKAYPELTVHEAPPGATTELLLGSDNLEELSARGVVVSVSED
jgi:hypothetical protein